MSLDYDIRIVERHNTFKPSKRTLALINDRNNWNPAPYTTLPLDGRTAISYDSAGEKTGWQSYLALQHRVRTAQDVEELRLSYRRFHSEYAKHTKQSQRIEFLDADHDDVDGVLNYMVEGQVVDYRTVEGADGAKHLSRICLMFPHAINHDGSRTPIDSHLWLPVFRGRVHVGEAGIEPHNRRGDRLLTIGLGDTLKVRGELHAYRDKRGCRRLGLGRWTPIDCRLRYFQRQADGHMVDRVVESRLDVGLTLAWVDARGFHTGRMARFEAELHAAEDRCPDVDSYGFLVDGSGWPTVCRGMCRVVDVGLGTSRVRIF